MPSFGNVPSFPKGELKSMSESIHMLKDLKVRLPVHYHMKLQTLKILKGKNMSESLCEALDMYFQERTNRSQATE